MSEAVGLKDGRTFAERYPFGVKLEQEGGVPNDVENWEMARHICRRHGVREEVCETIAEAERRGAVKALRAQAKRERSMERVIDLEQRADAIESGKVDL